MKTKKRQNITMRNKLSFAALYPSIMENIPSAEEKEIRGLKFIVYGENNKYPSYLYNLYKNVATLKTIIDGTADFVCGSEIASDSIIFNGDGLSDIVYDITLSYLIYGGFALNVLRNKQGKVVKIVPLDFRKVRSDKKGEKFYYSEDFDSKSYGRGKYIEYPAFDKDDVTAYSSIYYYKDDKYSVYPTPIYNAAIKACEIERKIAEYHLNSLENAFMGSVLVSLNNGVPDDEQKAEIEKNFNEKFTGSENAGRVVISYNDSKEHEATISQIQTEDYGERYKSLIEYSQQQIFTAFKATPAIFGIPTTDKGFSQEQYVDQFALFNAMVIKPLQKQILRSLKEVSDINIQIKPFKIEFEERTVNTEIITD